MSRLKKLTILIPCFNEEKGIGKVLDAIPKAQLKKLGFETEVLVIDNNSRDNTAAIAKKKGAKVVEQTIQGKRYALEMGFKKATGDYLITIDGDNTYPPQEIPKLVKEIDGNDLVVGSRFDTIWRIDRILQPRELAFQRTFANKVGAEMGSIILGKRITDVTTGMRLFKSDLLSRIPPIKAKNLDFEAELTARVISNGLKYQEVKINSNFREGKSSLNYFRDAFRFLWAMIRGRWA